MTHTPGPWFVRSREVYGEVVDCFVSAKDVNGFAYDAEILGDDEYRDSVERKLADSCRIVACVNALEGIPTEAIEAGAVRELVEAARAVQLQAENACLFLMDMGDRQPLSQANYRLRNALSKFGDLS